MSSALQRRLRGGLVVAMVVAALQLIGVMAPSGLAEAQSEVLARARAAMAAGNPGQAYDTLKPLESDRAGEPAFDYLLGIAALDSGRYTEAVFALERVLAIEPGNALARAEIARAYVRLGERETAEREFETVKARGDVPEEAKAAIERYLAAFRDTAGDAYSWRAYIALTLGYDSNVNSATADDTIGILGRAFNLDANAREQSDTFGVLGAGASMVAPVSGSAAIIGGANVSQRINRDQRAFDQANLGGYLGATVQDGRFTYTGVLQYSAFRLNRDAFRNSFGGTGQVRYALDSVSQLTGYGQVTRLTFPRQQIRNAYRYTLGAGYSRNLGGPFDAVLVAGAFGTVQDEIANGVDHLGYVGVGGNVGAELELSDGLRAYARGGIERRKYGGPEPLFSRTRHETRFSLNLGLDYEVAEDWVVSPNASLTRNNSNVAINDYDRAKFEVTVRRNFGN